MDFSIRLMKPEEHNFAYTQGAQILQDSGCIGHLRVDMDTNGTSFFTNWDDHTPELKTDAFKEEFDEMINALRFDEELGGILKNRESLRKFVNAVPQSSITEDNRSFGLRVDTDDYAYMVRMNPNRGEYAAYIYAYDRDMLNKQLEKEPITVLRVEPDKAPQKITIDSGLESLQREVDGWIEAVYPFEDPVAIVCNEEGKLDGLPMNRALRDEDGHIYDIIAGSFLVVGLTDDNFGSLTPDLMRKYSEKFRTPEAFLSIGGKILVFPQVEAKEQKSSVMGKLKDQTTTPKKDAPSKKHKEEIR